MSNSKPSTAQNNQKNEPKKEDEIEHNSNMPVDTIKFRRKLSRINTKMRKIIDGIINTIPKNVGSIYDGKIIKVKAIKNIGIADKIYEDKNVEEKDIYNVFSNEDHVIKNLMLQFKEKNDKDKIPKLVRKRMAFNRLYNITDSSIEKLNYAKSRKKLCSLEEYQENILKAVNVNSVEQSEIMKLIESFNEIKIESNNVTALPPININIIKDHIYKKKKILPKKKNFKDILKRRGPLDEFEKEERLIKKLRSYKTVPKRRRNKNFDILPQYIRDIFAKKAFS